MSKVTMPEPFGWLLDCLPGGGLAFQRERPSEMQSLVNSTGAVFTTDQAEAYAAAKVREALEEAAAICQQEGDEWDSDGVRPYKNYAHACRDRIRALIRPNTRPGQP